MTTQLNTTVLDVTLRDGGYQNQWNFSQDDAIALVSLLADAGIKHVEIGYRNCPPKESNVGLTGKTPNDFIKAVRAAVPDAKLAVMYSPSLITTADLEQMCELGVSMVRCSMPHTGADAALPLIKKAYDLGMVSTANMTNVTEYKMPDLVDEANRIIDNGCSVIYIADSNGHMTPESVRATFGVLRERLHPVQLGFHNHNMLGMAMANAIAAMDCGIDYIDGSLRGMGRSAGNVATENLQAYLLRRNGGQPGLLPAIVRAARYLSVNYPSAELHPGLEDMAFGAYDFDTLLGPAIAQAAGEYDVSWYALIARMATLDLDKPAITVDRLRAIARSMVDNNSADNANRR